MTKSSMCHFRTRWDFINPLAMESHTTNGISMLTSIHLYCARRRFANSWLDSNCWAMRNATSLQKSQHSGCAKSCEVGLRNQGAKHAALSQYVSRVVSYDQSSRGSKACLCAIPALERGES